MCRSCNTDVKRVSGGIGRTVKFYIEFISVLSQNGEKYEVIYEKNLKKGNRLI